MVKAIVSIMVCVLLLIIGVYWYLSYPYRYDRIMPGMTWGDCEDHLKKYDNDDIVNRGIEERGYYSIFIVSKGIDVRLGTYGSMEVKLGLPSELGSSDEVYESIRARCSSDKLRVLEVKSVTIYAERAVIVETERFLGIRPGASNLFQ